MRNIEEVDSAHRELFMEARLRYIIKPSRKNRAAIIAAGASWCEALEAVDPDGKKYRR